MPNRIHFEGHYVPYSDEPLEGVIETAAFIEHDDGRREFVLRGREADETIWEAHLYSSDGRLFAGKMTSKDWDYEYSVEMELWVSPTDDHERLLLGIWQAVEEEPVAWSITLWPPEDD